MNMALGLLNAMRAAFGMEPIGLCEKPKLTGGPSRCENTPILSNCDRPDANQLGMTTMSSTDSNVEGSQSTVDLARIPEGADCGDGVICKEPQKCHERVMGPEIQEDKQDEMPGCCENCCLSILGCGDALLF